MHITVFIDSLGGGGAERVACNLLNFLAERGHQATALTMSDTTDGYFLSDKVKRIVLLPQNERKNKIHDFILRYKRLRNYVKNSKGEQYVVMLPRTTIFLLWFKKLCTGRMIASERADPSIYPKYIKFLLKIFGKRADAWVFQTKAAQAWYQGIAKRSIIIPNAINPAFIRPLYTGERKQQVVAAGRLTEQKNFALLIRAFAKIAPKFPEHKLVIYGKGNLLDSLKSLANELSVGERVEFPGYVDNMPEALEKADMFVLSSDYEGMPNALMEAMALGLPCVSTDCGGGGAKFLIQDGENGLLVPKNDVEALANAMETILTDEDLAKKLGENSRKLQEALAPEKIYGKWEDFIAKIQEDNIWVEEKD